MPATLRGFRRHFGVAFPNDGSQRDKAYVEADGGRPPVVLFANVYPARPAESVNGICVPVDGDQLERLAGRELRYDTVDVTSAVHPLLAASRAGLDRVVMFAGKRRFTQTPLRDGVVPEAYAATMTNGARFWDEHVPSFYDEFLASTDWPVPNRIVALIPVVAGTSSGRPAEDSTLRTPASGE